MPHIQPVVPDIPAAMAGPISDEALRQIEEIGRQMQTANEVTAAEALLLIQCVGPIAGECLKRRQAMRVIRASSGELDNVTFIESRRDG